MVEEKAHADAYVLGNAVTQTPIGIDHRGYIFEYVCTYVCAFCMLSGINMRQNHVLGITSARYSRGNVTLSQFLKLVTKCFQR